MFNYHKDSIFTEPWFTEEVYSALSDIVTFIPDGDGSYIEIGCFEGKSTVAIANLIYPETLEAVDPWVPVDYAFNEKRIYAERDIESHFRHNVKIGTKKNVSINKMGWQEFFSDWNSEIKFLYLDGPHSYPDVTRQLGTIYPFIMNGGVICGDDYNDSHVKRAVNKFFGKEDMAHPECECTWWHVKKEDA
jgi:hypothetical protein